MFASTNLVIELGILIFIFLGPEFVVAELIGGPILMARLAGGLKRSIVGWRIICRIFYICRQFCTGTTVHPAASCLGAG